MMMLCKLNLAWTGMVQPRSQNLVNNLCMR